MEQGYSLYNGGGSMNFDLQNIEPAGDEEEKEALEEAKQKEKELQDALATAFDDLIDDDYDDDQYSHYSEDQLQVAEEENNYSAQPSTETVPSIYSKSPSGNSGVQLSNHSQNRGYCAEADNQSTQSDNQSTQSFTLQERFSIMASDESYAAAAQAINHRYKDLLALKHIREHESSADDSSESKNYEYQNGCPTENSEFPNDIEHTDDEVHNVNFSKQNYDEGEQHDSKKNCATQKQVPDTEQLKLQVLYDARGREIERLRKELQTVQTEFGTEIKILQHQLALMEGEKEGLCFSLQQSQCLVSDKTHAYNALEGNFHSLELQLASERKAKEEIIKKMEGAENTLKSLEKQIVELSNSENLARAREQHERVVNNLKLRHQQEALEMKQEIDSHRHLLDTKVEEVKLLHHQMKQLEHKYQELQLDKAETINRLTASLETSQQQCQQLLESGVVSEVSKVKMQLQHVLEEKCELETRNKELQGEINALVSELKSFEAAHRLGISNLDNLEDSAVQFGLQRKKFNKTGDVNFHTEFERALSCLSSQRATITSLQERLRVTEKELTKQSEKAKEFKLKAEAAQKSAAECQMKIDELCPEGSIPVARFQKELSTLENERGELNQKLEEVQHHLREVSESEEKLNEINRQLREEMSEMVKHHDEDKQLALQRCRESSLQLHEGAMSRLKADLTSQAKNEMHKIQFDYENKITTLRREITVLNDALYDVKNQYIGKCEDAKYLQENFQELDKEKMKLRKEMEDEYQVDFLNKLQKIQVELEKQKKEFFENKIHEEVSKAQKIWALQKTKDAENYIIEVKNKLDKEFQACLKQEKEMYQSKLSRLKDEWEKEKFKSLEDLKERLTIQWTCEMNDLEEQHQQQIQKIAEEKNVVVEELEIKLLEKVKNNAKQLEKNLKEKLNVAAETENRLRERLRKYQKLFEKMTTEHKEELEKLKVDMLQQIEAERVQRESDLKEIKDKFALQLLTTENYYKKTINENKVEKSNCYCQTDEILVPKLLVIEMHDIMLHTLRKIQDHFMNYLEDSRKRSTERLHSALVEYRQQIAKNLFKDALTSKPVSTTNRLYRRGKEGSGQNGTHRKSRYQDTHSRKYPRSTSPRRNHSVSSSSEDSVHQIRPCSVQNNPSNADIFYGTSASGDGYEASAGMLLGKFDGSGKQIHVPQQKSVFSLPTQVLRLPNGNFLSSRLEDDLQETVNSYFPERLVPEKHS